VASSSVTAVPDPLLVETVVLDAMWRAPDNAEHGDSYRISWFERGLAIERGCEQ